MREMKQYDSFKAALLETIGTADVTIQPVSGGDINCAYRLSGNGQHVFMKANRERNIDFFIAEVAGLRAIAETRTIRVPEVLAIGRDGKYGAFLLLEWRYFNEFPDSFNDNLRNWFWIVLTTEYKCHHEFRSAKRHISCISSCCNHAYCRPGDEHGNTDTCICIHYG